jgi:hypothetical protein
LRSIFTIPSSSWASFLILPLEDEFRCRSPRLHDIILPYLETLFDLSYLDFIQSDSISCPHQVPETADQLLIALTESILCDQPRNHSPLRLLHLFKLLLDLIMCSSVEQDNNRRGRLLDLTKRFLSSPCCGCLLTRRNSESDILLQYQTCLDLWTESIEVGVSVVEVGRCISSLQASVCYSNSPTPSTRQQDEEPSIKRPKLSTPTQPLPTPTVTEREIPPAQTEIDRDYCKNANVVEILDHSPIFLLASFDEVSPVQPESCAPPQADAWTLREGDQPTANLLINKFNITF